MNSSNRRLSRRAEQSGRGRDGRPRRASSAPPRTPLPAVADEGGVLSAIAALRAGFGRLLIDGRAISLDDIDPAVVVHVVTKWSSIASRCGQNCQRVTDSIETSYARVAVRPGPFSSGDESVARDAAVFRKIRVPCVRDFSRSAAASLSFNVRSARAPHVTKFPATSSNLTWGWWCLIPPSRSCRTHWAGANRTIAARLARRQAGGEEAKSARCPWAELTDEERHFVIEGGTSSRASDARGSADFSDGSNGRNTRCTSRVSQPLLRLFDVPGLGGARRRKRDVRA